MSDFSVKIQGLPQLVSFFENVAGAALNETIDKALDQSGLETLTVLKGNTPIDTGNLRDSEFIEKEGTTVFVGPDLGKAHYAPYVEYGFHHYISGKFIPGQHYVELTALAMQPRIVQIFKSHINQLFKSYGS